MTAAALCPLMATGEGVAQANLTSTAAGVRAGEIYFAGASAAYSSQPYPTATGAAGSGYRCDPQADHRCYHLQACLLAPP